LRFAPVRRGIRTITHHEDHDVSTTVDKKKHYSEKFEYNI